MYEKSQYGTIVIISVLAFIIAMGIFQLYHLSIVVIGVMIFLAILLSLFYKLNVKVDKKIIKISFGIGLISKKFKLYEIKSFRRVRNKWWYGFGIRVIPGGTLFNVNGLDAVELTMKNGSVYRIGTSEPKKLYSAISKK
jgi:hypothetical protein